MVMRGTAMQQRVDPLGSGIEDARDTEYSRPRDVFEYATQRRALSRRKAAFQGGEDAILQISRFAIAPNLLRIPPLQECSARDLIVEPFCSDKLDLLSSHAG